MLRMILSAIIGTIALFIGSKVFAIIFWGTGIDMILDAIDIDDIKIQEVSDDKGSI